MIEINQKEVIRYLGFKHNAAPDEVLMKKIEACEARLQNAIRPKSIRLRLDLNLPEPGAIEFGGIRIQSKSLSKNLANCSSVFVFGATLGIGADRLIKRAQIRKMSEAVIYQAAAASMIESYCDIINEEIRDEAKKESLYTRPRYSPGYGDCPLEVQKDLVRLLDAPKKIGLTLTDSLLMMPSKSVTAIIGLSKVPVLCHPQGCEICSKVDCAYRRDN